MARIPDSVVEEVRSTVDLVDVVSDYVRLKKQGVRFIGLCPFHNEKTPSFSVDPRQSLFYCFGCLEEHEPIWTGRGLIPIGEVGPGDTVLGIDGRSEIVIQRVVKEQHVLALELDAVRRDPLLLTPDHTCTVVRAADAEHGVPMLYRQAGRGLRFQTRRRSYLQPRACEIEEVAAELVRPGDYFVFPIIPEERRADEPLAAPRAEVARAGSAVAVEVAEAVMPVAVKGPAPKMFDALPVNPRSARLYGLWLAEGSVYRGGVRWSFHATEWPLAEYVVAVLKQEFGLDASMHHRPERTQLEVTCSNTHLSFLFPRWFGRGAAGKQVPSEALSWTRETQLALLQGYLDGDGANRNGTWSALTISSALARGVFALAIQAGRAVSFSREPRQTTAGNELWVTRLLQRESVRGFFYPIRGTDYYWMRVASIEAVEGTHRVVDISVTGSETFTTKLGAVHNCKAGGDLFKFVEQVEGVGFLDAVRLLAERAGIEIVEEEGSREEASAREAMLAALRFAMRFYFDQLKGPGGKRGLDYLKDRGFTKETIKAFGIGYAPVGWDALLKAATKEGFKPEVLEAVGLVKGREGGGHYDLFRDRLMFPILDRAGKVLGFGGRILPGSPTASADYTPAKYINTAETAVFHKSDVLFGLKQAKLDIRREEEVIIVEGYADVVSLHQAGIKNVVASSGTALTAGQIRSIAELARTAVLLYDADAAGVNAALKGVEAVLRAGLAVSVVTLPEGADPDSFVRQFGAEGGTAFRSYLREHRQDFVAFIAGQARKEGLFASPEGKAEAARRLLDAVALVRDPIAQDDYLLRSAAGLGVPDATLRPQLRRRMQERSDGRSPAGPPPPAPPEALPAADARGMRPYVPPPVIMRPEEAVLLRLMLEHGPPMVEHVLTRMALDEFSEGVVREIVGRLIAQYETGTVEAEPYLRGDYGEEAQRLTAEVLTERHALSENWQRRIGVSVPGLDAQPFEAAVSAMRLLKLDRVEEAIEAVKRQVFVTEQQGEDLLALNKQMNALNALKRQIEQGAFLEWGEAKG